MKEVKTQLQTKIFDLLSNDGLDVYDVAPTDAEYPFVEVGETSENENVDKDNYGQDVTFTFHIRDRFQGSAGSRANLYDIAEQFRGRGLRKVNLPARPFLWPAFVEERPKHIARLEAILGKPRTI